MNTANKKKSNIVHITIEDELHDALKAVTKSESTYQEKTAKQLEALQDRLAKEHDSKNRILFWSIFGGILLLNCIVFQHIASNLAIFSISVMDFVLISCSANTLGQENALKLLNWIKNLIEEAVHNLGHNKKKK